MLKIKIWIEIWIAQRYFNKWKYKASTPRLTANQSQINLFESPKEKEKKYSFWAFTALFI